MDVVRQLLAIVVVFGLLWLALWLLKRNGKIRTSATNPKTISSCDRLALTAQHSLHLIRAGDRRVLLGLHSTGFTVICDVPDSSAAKQVAHQ